MKTKLLLSIFAPYAVLAVGALLFSSAPVLLWQVAGAGCLFCVPLTAWAMFEACPGGRTGKYVFNQFFILLPHLFFYSIVGFLGLAKFIWRGATDVEVTRFLLADLRMENMIYLLCLGLVTGGYAWLISVDLLKNKSSLLTDSSHQFIVNWR